MSRALRIEYPNATYHVSNHISTQHKTLFRSLEDRQAFLDLMAQCEDLYKIKFYAYRLQSNIYHLLCMTPRANLGRVMRHLNGLYTQYYNRTYGKRGSLFEGRYRAVLIDADQFFLPCLLWIHGESNQSNVPDAESGPKYTSRFYCDHPDGEPDWLSLKEALIMLCPEYGSHSTLAYKNFAAEGIDPSLQAFYQNQKSGTILGSPEFHESLRAKFKDPLAWEESLWRRRKAQLSIPHKTLLQRLRKYFNITDQELFRSRRGETNEYRKAAVYLLRKSGYTLKEIMRIMKFKTYVAACYIYRTIRSEIARSPQMAREIQSLSLYIYDNK